MKRPVRHLLPHRAAEADSDSRLFRRSILMKRPVRHLLPRRAAEADSESRLFRRLILQDTLARDLSTLSRGRTSVSGAKSRSRVGGAAAACARSASQSAAFEHAFFVAVRGGMVSVLLLLFRRGGEEPSFRCECSSRGGDRVSCACVRVQSVSVRRLDDAGNAIVRMMALSTNPEQTKRGTRSYEDGPRRIHNDNKTPSALGARASAIPEKCNRPDGALDESTNRQTNEQNVVSE